MPQLTFSSLPSNPMASSTYSSTSRTAKFIPAEFKNKHLGDSPSKLPRPHKKSAEIASTFHKKPSLHQPGSPFGSQKSIE